MNLNFLFSGITFSSLSHFLSPFQHRTTPTDPISLCASHDHHFFFVTHHRSCSRHCPCSPFSCCNLVFISYIIASFMVSRLHAMLSSHNYSIHTMFASAFVSFRFVTIRIEVLLIVLNVHSALCCSHTHFLTRAGARL